MFDTFTVITIIVTFLFAGTVKGVIGLGLAIISLGLGIINWLWLVARFRETLPIEKRTKASSRKGAIFELGKISSGAVKKTCLTYLFYMISFSGMEFTLTFLAVERFNYQPSDIAKMFLLIGFTLILAQGLFVRRFVGPLGEKRLAMAGILIGILAFFSMNSGEKKSDGSNSFNVVGLVFIVIIK